MIVIFILKQVKEKNVTRFVPSYFVSRGWILHIFIYCLPVVSCSFKAERINRDIL